MILDTLTKRERLLIFAGSITIVVLLFIILLKSIISWRVEYANKANESRSEINSLERLITKYNLYKTLQSGSGENNVNNIYTKLDPILIRYSLKSNVASMKDAPAVVLKKYQRITIDINFKSVPLNNVFKMIYDIEKNKQINARIDYFKFRKPFAEKEIYDVNIKLSSYSKS